MTDAKRAALELISGGQVPIANPMTVASLASLPLPEARAALESLSKAGLIDWQPATRGADGAVLADAMWTLTAQGWQALADG
jgi:hypothetical protein